MNFLGCKDMHSYNAVIYPDEGILEMPLS